MFNSSIQHGIGSQRHSAGIVIPNYWYTFKFYSNFIKQWAKPSQLEFSVRKTSIFNFRCWSRLYHPENLIFACSILSTNKCPLLWLFVLFNCLRSKVQVAFFKILLFFSLALCSSLCVCIEEIYFYAFP